MKFKTNFVLRTLFIALFFASTISIVEAQEKEKPIVTSLIKICDQEAFCCGPIPPSPYNCDSTTIIGTIKNDRLNLPYVEVSLAAYVVDLPNEDNDDVVSWPEGEFPICLRYEYAEGYYRYTELISSWRYVADYKRDSSEVTHKIYRGDVIVEYDYEPTCIYTTDDNNIMVRNVALYSSITEGHYFPYPIDPEGNGAHDGIFSCDVFEETCSFCYSDCQKVTDPIYDLKICTDCIQRVIKEGGNPRQQEDPETMHFHSLSVQPNPFTNFVEYGFFIENDALVNIQLFSVNGKEVLQKTKSVASGKHTFSLNTDHLPKGIYYLKISNGEHSEVARLIKME